MSYTPTQADRDAYLDYVAQVGSPLAAAPFGRWLLQTGRIGEATTVTVTAKQAFALADRYTSAGKTEMASAVYASIALGIAKGESPDSPESRLSFLAALMLSMGASR